VPHVSRVFLREKWVLTAAKFVIRRVGADADSVYWTILRLMVRAELQKRIVAVRKIVGRTP